MPSVDRHTASEPVYRVPLSPPRIGLLPVPPGLVMPGELVEDPVDPEVLSDVPLDVPLDVPELESLGAVLEEPGEVVLLEPLG